MALKLETLQSARTVDMDAAASITAKGFGREADEHNYQDTRVHLESADFLQTLHDDEQLVAFAAYRRQLWRPSN
jgi:O-glycosyl hydrolase